jgi:hypothetical protein
MSGKAATKKATNRKVITGVIPAVIGAVVSAFFLTVFRAQPQVPTSTGQKFFDNYYREVTQADQRRALYLEDLTTDFQKSPGVSWPDYISWWESQKQVVVDQVESVPGNPLEFTVWLTYYPTRGNPQTQVISFSLVCNGWWPSLVARIPTLGCPVNHLQIQSGLDVTPAK